jgi:RNA polymerase sigma factor (sigma-70 family)
MQINANGTGQFASYDDVFLERYDSVLRWALQITKYDRELAEDLVHEVYVQFTVTRQNPAAVNSIDNYLYVALRNAYISYLRRTVRHRVKQLSLIEFDSVDNALLAVDPREQIAIHEKLRAVCRYACLRKETSISGSVLILRFFHGYFPNEVARILNCSANAVEARLVTARREAAAFLANPASLDCLNRSFAEPKLSYNFIKRHHDLLNELRAEIFQARQGDCYDSNTIKSFYGREESRLNRKVMSHLVSCPRCLNETNKIHDLPLLVERHPLDTLGRDKIVSEEQTKALKRSAGLAAV